MVQLTLEGIIIGLIIGASIKGFFDSFGKDIYNWTKDFIVSRRKIELSDSKLVEKTEDLAQEILDFLNLRKTNEPFDLSNTKKYGEEIIKHYNETMASYHSEFSFRVVNIRQEYIKRNLKSDNLEKDYTNPTNPFGILYVTYGLIELAEKLKSI